MLIEVLEAQARVRDAKIARLRLEAPAEGRAE